MRSPVNSRIANLKYLAFTINSNRLNIINWMMELIRIVCERVIFLISPESESKEKLLIYFTLTKKTVRQTAIKSNTVTRINFAVLLVLKSNSFSKDVV